MEAHAYKLYASAGGIQLEFDFDLIRTRFQLPKQQPPN
jgi:hypothetical protein